MNRYGASMTSWLRVVSYVGIAIWAVPLVWYYKYYKKENQQ